MKLLSIYLVLQNYKVHKFTIHRTNKPILRNFKLE